ncbi:MAG: hypothetical protein AAGB48_08790 [Planctomycetota bacterium]
MGPRPHISAALGQLRLGVNLCAGAVVLACLLQLAVFACIHFTDLRWETLERSAPPTPTIVTASASEGPTGLRELLTAEPRQVVTVEDPVATAPANPVDINRVRSSVGVLLERFSQSATIFGVFGAVALCVLTVMGTIVAGGGAVPGVERAVSASTWGLIVAMMVLPWSDIFASMPFAGVFASYGSMTTASDLYQNTTLMLVLLYIGIPLMAMLGTFTAAAKFHSGVERGILDPRAPDDVDMDMAENVRNIGSRHQAAAVRTDFRKTFGNVPSAPPSVAAPRQAEPEPGPQASGPASGPARRRSTLNSTEVDDWKRPI